MKILRRRWFVVLVCGAALLLATVHGLHRLARSRTYQVFGKLVPRMETTKRVVALTFDDGPTEVLVDDILGVLASRHVRATFFVTGADMAAAPAAAQRLVAAGHELGNHTYSHRRMVLRSQAFFRSEVERTDELIRAAGEKGEIYFRMPHGWKLVGLPWFLWRTGRTAVTWDVDPAPNPKATPEMIVAGTLELVRPGSIILLHPWYQSGPSVRAALPLIIDKLQAQGYQFLTVDELLRINTIAPLVTMKQETLAGGERATGPSSALRHVDDRRSLFLDALARRCTRRAAIDGPHARETELQWMPVSLSSRTSS